ncbi:SERAC1 [Echria macrotheca]|uniref:SERAC1 n=1 Tax=Echria macrotheca TaxID=438768 RepID=A0AAJ0F9P0_9PEZI|nr:SERAC1 [Echria macrotheca]
MPQRIAAEGITVLDGPFEQGENAVDYVFLHGLNGDPKDTWSYEAKGNDGFFWPRQLLVDIPGCRVMTFGYNAAFERALIDNTTNINAISETLVTQLITNRKGAYVNRPLIFIAHSLGGLVVKRALCNIHMESHNGLQTRKIREQNAIYDAVSGIVFMGTPHAGSHVADAARTKLLKAIARATFKKPPERIVNALSAHSQELQDLSNSFENTTIFTKHVIEICTYYESMTQKFAGEEVVPRDMAILHYLNERKEPIPKEHTKMAKFEDATDPLYKSVCDRLGDMATDGLEALRARQDTYRILQIPSDIKLEQAPGFLSTCADGVLGPQADLRVHSLASRAGQSDSAKMATVTFINVPVSLLEKRKSKEKQWSIPFVHGGRHRILTVDIQANFSGFTFLSDNSAADYVMDIIALPGLGYDPFTSWQCNPAADPFMWLRDSLPGRVPGAQVILYGYETDLSSRSEATSIQAMAVSLISGLRGIGLSAPSAKPVVFLAHSLGGLVLKECLVELAKAGASELFMLQRVRACIFLAVPNCLPDPSELAAIVPRHRMDGLLEDLQAARNVRYLESVSGMLEGICKANRIRLCSGFETVKSIIDAPEGPGSTTGHTQRSAFLLKESQSIHGVSRESDLFPKFPIAKPHREIVGLEAGNQAIDTVATYINDAIRSISVTDVASSPRFIETKIRKNAVTDLIPDLLSWFGGKRPAQDSGTVTQHRPPTVDAEMLMTASEYRNSSLYRQFLSTLKDHGREREKGISKASKGTFDWIWTNTEIGFPAWITNDQPLFWIRGKPGSGKSTIMRYIWDHPNLSKLADDGTPERPRVKAAFFFYYRGTHLQKSFEGMLHTILLRLLTLEPRLAGILLPEFAKLDNKQCADYTWTLPMLTKAYQEVLVRNKLPLDILLFIDALDEYDGPPEAIVDFIQSSVQTSRHNATSLKICFSSREWDAFDKGFSKGPGFRIHEHTKADIDRYITSRLSSHPKIAERLASGTEHERSDITSMERSLSERANGVFIWVRAVIDEIHRRFFQHSGLGELLRFLEDVPDDLDLLYTYSIKRLPHEYRMEAYYMFEIMLKANDSLPSASLKTAVLSRKWVQERGASLVDIGRGHDRPSFIHQTVVDFLTRPGFRGIIFGHAFELPLENGYSLLSKWDLAEAQVDFFEDSNHRGFPVLSSKFIPSNALALAERTTANLKLVKCDPFNSLVRVMLDRGQDANETIASGDHFIRKKAAPIKLHLISALHVATADLAEILLDHGAKVNALDDMGRTPLDYACGVGGDPLELGVQTRLEDVYPLAVVLVKHGAKLSEEGREPWRLFLELILGLAPELEGELSDSFRNPGFIRHSKVNRLVYKAKGWTSKVGKHR